MQKNIFFTQKGFEQIKESIESSKDLILEKGKKVVQARMGNEQAEISEAILEEIAENYNLQRLEDLLRTASLIESHNNKNLVDFGDKINLELNGEELSVVLTGNYLRKDDEITINSPLGSSIFKKATDENFKFKVGNRESKGTIKEIIKQEKINESEISF